MSDYWQIALTPASLSWCEVNAYGGLDFAIRTSWINRRSDLIELHVSQHEWEMLDRLERYSSFAPESLRESLDYASPIAYHYRSQP